MEPTETTAPPTANTSDIQSIVLKSPSQLSAMIAPMIVNAYARSSFVWKIAVEVLGSKFNLR